MAGVVHLWGSGVVVGGRCGGACERQVRRVVVVKAGNSRCVGTVQLGTQGKARERQCRGKKVVWYTEPQAGSHKKPR